MKQGHKGEWLEMFHPMEKLQLSPFPGEAGREHKNPPHWGNKAEIFTPFISIQITPGLRLCGILAPENSILKVISAL